MRSKKETIAPIAMGLAIASVFIGSEVLRNLSQEHVKTTAEKIEDMARSIGRQAVLNGDQLSIRPDVSSSLRTGGVSGGFEIILSTQEKDSSTNLVHNGLVFAYMMKKSGKLDPDTIYSLQASEITCLPPRNGSLDCRNSRNYAQSERVTLQGYYHGFWNAYSAQLHDLNFPTPSLLEDPQEIESALAFVSEAAGIDQIAP